MKRSPSNCQWLAETSIDCAICHHSMAGHEVKGYCMVCGHTNPHIFTAPEYFYQPLEKII